MNDLITKSLDEVFDTLAQTYDEPPSCPVAASLACHHAEASPELRRFFLCQIAHNHAEPWAQQVAAEWLRDNQELYFRTFARLT